MKFINLLILVVVILGVSFNSAVAKDAEIYQVQKKLAEMGYKVGAPDGVMGRKTINAIKKFQRDYGLPVTAMIDYRTKNAMESALRTQLAVSNIKQPSPPARSIKVARVVDQIGHGRKMAIVIGINAYPSMPLEAAVADANAVSKRLKELNFDVTTLIDNQATLLKINNELGTRLAKTNKNDQVLIYFAGHGITEKLANDQLEGYILPVDVNLKDVYSTAISMKNLRDLSRRIPAKHLLFVFDSCYSGLGFVRSVPRQTKGDLQRYLENLAGNRAVYMITAGKKNEVAREVGGHGLFTLHFLDGIAGAADFDPRDGIVQASELGRFLRKKVSRDTKKYQNPQHGLIQGDGDFLFPLQNDDPVRLKKSLLSKLDAHYNELVERKTVQDDFALIQDMLKTSEERVRDEYDMEIEKLDKQIRKKQREIDELNQGVSRKTDVDRSRQRYSVMRFLNTGVELDIVKVFPNMQAANAYYSNVLGTQINLHNRSRKHLPAEIRDKTNSKLQKANAYPTKIEFYIEDDDGPLIIDPVGYHFSGFINYARIQVQTPGNIMLKNIKNITSPLQSDKRVLIVSIIFIIAGIDNNEKLLTFSQMRDRLIARYGQPTSKGSEITVIDWKKFDLEHTEELIWEDENAKLYLTGSGGSFSDAFVCASDSLAIVLINKSKTFIKMKQQAHKIFEAEAFVMLKKRIEEMAEIERKAVSKAAKLQF